MAAAWCDYLKQHALRLYGMGTNPELENARSILEKIKAGKLPKGCEGFKVKDIRQRGWAGLTETQDVKNALDVLEEYGWLRSEISTGTEDGRPSTRYLLHPSLTGGAHV